MAAPVGAVLGVDGWAICHLLDNLAQRWERQHRSPPQPTAAEAVRAYWAALGYDEPLSQTMQRVRLD